MSGRVIIMAPVMHPLGPRATCSNVAFNGGLTHMMILPPFLFMMHLMMQMHSRDHQPTRRKVGVGFLYHPASWARHRRQCEPGRSVAQCYGLTRAGRLRGTEICEPKVYRIVAPLSKQHWENP